jgi:NADH dehydrogenase
MRGNMKHIVVAGGGFAGLKAARTLCKNKKDVKVTLIDKANHHLFQPLLYQVAAAGLSESDIAVPIRSIFSKQKNLSVLKGEVIDADFRSRSVITDFGKVKYDYLIMACGVQHTYFGNDSWESYAPGLKTLEQAVEIRRRILSAFEEAEREPDINVRKMHLTFVIVGGGPTGVELAGAIGEMSRYTIARDFRNIDPKLTRIILVEAGSRILSSFPESQSSRAVRDLEKLGVQVWTSSAVTSIDACGIEVGNERIDSATVLWAAGVKATEINDRLDVRQNDQGRVIVKSDLSIEGYPEVFIAGDQACFEGEDGQPLPCISPVAIQQGKSIAQNILRDIKGVERENFRYFDKGQMATIGRSRALVDLGFMRLQGFIAWLTWLFVHIYFITGFNNRLQIFIKWVISYITNKKGARIILRNKWKMFDPEEELKDNDSCDFSSTKISEKSSDVAIGG